ncbi:MAG: molybdopterin molybdotransferase MoeA [Actinomycetaceae bacterium]|nr:molybdopterin molybdotransferase MoeA [Actinomycetaceae bacterium]
MKSVSQHLKECLALVEPLPPFFVELAEAVGCVLAEDVRSLVDVPAANLAACDGYAVKADEIAGARSEHPVTLPVTGEIFASHTHGERHAPKTAIRIASGARMPADADTVVPLELTNQDKVEVEIRCALETGSHVRLAAEDVTAGEVVLEHGLRLSSRHIALLAATGHSRVLVHPMPRVVVMSVGDELVETGQGISQGQVYDANGHGLTNAAQSAGAEVFRVGPISDEQNILRNAIEDQLVRADILIISGGLSYGGGDTVKDVLSPLGSVRFDTVAITPGRQFGLGALGENTLVFCLPGDPAAALIAFEVFVRPVLRKISGYSHLMARTVSAKALHGFPATFGRRDFLCVKVYGSASEGYTFEVAGSVERPLLSAFAAAHAVAVVPEDVDTVAIGDEIVCMILPS